MLKREGLLREDCHNLIIQACSHGLRHPIQCENFQGNRITCMDQEGRTDADAVLNAECGICSYTSDLPGFTGILKHR
jgi:hypothetical protein